MRRSSRMILILFLFLAMVAVAGACKVVPMFLDSTPAIVSPTAAPTVVSTATPLPTLTSLPPTNTTSPVPPMPESNNFKLELHPDGGLVVGDMVSFEVIAPPNASLRDAQAQITLSPVVGDTNPPFVSPSIGPVPFAPFGIDGRQQATFIWAWDTHGLGPGDYTATVTIKPQNITFTQTVRLLPSDSLSPLERQAHWASARSQCCVLNYITGTASERDLQALLTEADNQARDTIQRMGVEFSEPITVTVLPRVLGHGGFTTDEIQISYLDRNYAGSNFAMVLHHEMIHILDGRLGGDFRPTIFVEGLAVYQSGGHFKPEALLPRAAALLDPPLGLGWYIPLTQLADNFYPSQHEIGYLEAGALIEFMVKTWGYPAFSAFYRDIHPDTNGLQSRAIDTALQKHFHLGFVALEQQFINELRKNSPDDEQRDDLRMTVHYYDTMRRYQQLLDPSTFFRSAWLMDPKQMRQRAIVADNLRHPIEPINLALETMLVSADDALNQGRYLTVEQLLNAVNTVLDGVQANVQVPFAHDPLSASYMQIVQLLLASGYQPQRIAVENSAALAWVSTATDTALIQLHLILEDGAWRLAQRAGNRLGSERNFWSAYSTIKPRWVPKRTASVRFAAPNFENTADM